MLILLSAGLYAAGWLVDLLLDLTALCDLADEVREW